MKQFYHNKTTNQEYYESKRRPIEIFFNYRHDRLALPAHQARYDKKPHRPTYHRCDKKSDKIYSVTPAGIAQTLVSSGVKPQVKTISKKLVRTLTN